MLRDGRLWVSGAMAALFAGMVAMAITYSPEARFAPLIVGVPGLLLALTQLVLDLRGHFAARPLPIETTQSRSAGVLIAWFAGFIASAILLGVLFTALVGTVAFWRVQQNESWRLSAALAAGLTLVIYLVFEKLLGLELFRGLVFGSLGF